LHPITVQYDKSTGVNKNETGATVIESQHKNDATYSFGLVKSYRGLLA